MGAAWIGTGVSERDYRHDSTLGSRAAMRNAKTLAVGDGDVLRKPVCVAERFAGGYLFTNQA